MPPVAMPAAHLFRAQFGHQASCHRLQRLARMHLTVDDVLKAILDAALHQMRNGGVQPAARARVPAARRVVRGSPVLDLT